MVYGRYLHGAADSLSVFCGAQYCAVRGWRFEGTRNNGTSGGFHSRETTTVDHPLDVRAWLAVANEENDQAHSQKGRERGPDNAQS